MQYTKRYLAATGLTMGMLVGSAAALPPVMDRVPADAVMVVSARSMDHVHERFSMLTTALELPVPLPPIEQVLMMGGVGGGVDTGRPIAAAFMGLDMDADVPPMVVLAPVTDYGEFVGGLGGNATGGIDTVMIQGEEAFLKRMPDGYAAMSPVRDLLEGFEGAGGNVAAHRAAMGQWGVSVAEASDLSVHFNIERLRPLVEPQIREGFAGMGDMMMMMGGADVDFEGAEAFVMMLLEQGTGAVAGLRIEQVGVSLDFGMNFREGSDMARALARGGNTAELIGRLPRQQFLLLTAMDMSSPDLKRFMIDATKALQADEEAAPGMFMANMEAMDGQAMLLGSSPGMLMGGGVFTNTVMFIKASDPEQYLRAYRSDMEALDGLNVQGMTYETSYTPGATEVNGVSVDSWQTRIRADATNPMAGQMMAMLFGPGGGPSGYMAKTEGGLVQTMSRNSLLLGAALDAAVGRGGLGEDRVLMQVSERLPSGRIAEAYVGVKPILDMIMPFMAMMGMQLDVDMPDTLPPVGAGIGAGQGGAQGSVFLPMPVLKLGAEFSRQMEGPGGAFPAPQETGQPRF